MSEPHYTPAAPATPDLGLSFVLPTPFHPVLRSFLRTTVRPAKRSTHTYPHRCCIADRNGTPSLPHRVRRCSSQVNPKCILELKTSFHALIRTSKNKILLENMKGKVRKKTLAENRTRSIWTSRLQSRVYRIELKAGCRRPARRDSHS